MTRHRFVSALAAVVGVGLLALPLVSAPALAQTKGPVVFAAASLQTALDDIKAQWQKSTGKEALISYGGSSALAKQIEAGAPADIFISADIDWMDYVAGKSAIKAGTRSDLLANALVLVAAKDSKIATTIAKGFPLATLLGKDGKLAMATVDSVPAGKYGKASLQSLGVWDAVSKNVAQTADVRAALALVARGEAPLGIVYLTDANAEPGVKVIGTFPEDSHPKITYPLAITTTSTNPDAAAFVAYLKSPAAAPLFAKQGFTLLQ